MRHRLQQLTDAGTCTALHMLMRRRHTSTPGNSSTAIILDWSSVTASPHSQSYAQQVPEAPGWGSHMLHCKSSYELGICCAYSQPHNHKERHFVCCAHQCDELRWVLYGWTAGCLQSRTPAVLEEQGMPSCTPALAHAYRAEHVLQGIY